MHKLQYSKGGQIRHCRCFRNQLLKVLLYLPLQVSNGVPERRELSHRLREYSLQEHLHDIGRIWENCLHNLCLLSDGCANLLEQVLQPRLKDGRWGVWIRKSIPSARA